MSVSAIDSCPPPSTPLDLRQRMRLCLPAHNYEQAHDLGSLCRAVLRQMALLSLPWHAGALQCPLLTRQPVGALGRLEKDPGPDTQVVLYASVL